MNRLATEQGHLRRWLFCCLVVSLWLVTGCEPAAPTPVTLSGHTMGTTWHVTYLPSARSSDNFQGEIDGMLEGVNASMSTYREDSEISRFNRARPNEWFAISPGFLTVLQAALLVGEASGGAYDVTIGLVVDLWGFGPKAGVDAVPGHDAIVQLLQRVGQSKLKLNPPDNAVLKTGELSLDFSSIAKGYAVDRVADWLAGQGVANFLVEVGGEMRLAGHNARGEAWRIAIEKPGGFSGSVATAIGLSNEAVATSGDYRNYFEVDNIRYSHAIDARTGYPVQHDLVSVTVIHPRAMMADAWATALTALGPEEAMEVALRQELAVYFIQRKEDNYVTRYTPQFERYLENSGRQKK